MSFSYISIILGSRVVVQNLEDNLTDLVKVRTTWAAPYPTELRTRIDTTANNLLGNDAATKLFAATDNLQKAIQPARRDISMLKVQIDYDYGKDPVKRKIILTDLGLDNIRKASTHQSDLVGLLITYVANIDKYKAEFVTNGTPAELLERIGGYATVIDNYNTIQETLKSDSKAVSEVLQKELHDLYYDIIWICKIAAGSYLESPAKKEKFTFSKIVKNLGLPQPTIEPTEIKS